MAYYRINGGKRLEGAVTISGAKNAALAIIPAVILSGESCLLENLPEIEDVRIVEEILTSMGADISRTPDGSMRIDPSGISTFSVTGEMVSSMRASYYLLGALLGRYKKAEIALPGGCAIGQRPIDQHIKGMRALGADIVIQGGSVKARADRLRGAEIYLDVVSVDPEFNLIAVCGAVPGPKGGIVYLKSTVKTIREKKGEAGTSVNPQKASARANPQKASARNR